MELKDKDFIRLRDFMYSNFGINLAQKKMLIESRLNNIVIQKGYLSFAEYIDNLMEDKTGSEVSILVSKLTTNFTYFMREERHFEFLQSVALPELLPRIRDNSLNIWSAGCSSGEEPYTIAMILEEFFKNGKQNLDSKILATDISPNVLKAAYSGIYTDDRMNKIPPHWYKKNFVKVKDNTYQVMQKIKDEVIFRNFNLMENNFQFKKKFHVIFCRNVMIYFDSKTRESLANRFYESMHPGGYLFIGMSETLINSNTQFKYVSPSIYQRV